MHPIFSRCAALCACTLLAACAISAPRYQAVDSNVALLKAAAGARAGVGTFTASPALGRSRIDLHAIDMKAPEGDYAAYLKAALAADLSAAGLLDAAAPAQVSATLLRNEISAVRMHTHSGAVEARFVVTRGGQPVYDKLKRAKLSWETHVVGGMDTVTARGQYPKLVAALLAELYGDPDFVQALQR